MSKLTTKTVKDVGSREYYNSAYWDYLPQVIADVMNIDVVIWTYTNKESFYKSIFKPRTEIDEIELKIPKIYYHTHNKPQYIIEDTETPFLKRSIELVL